MKKLVTYILIIFILLSTSLFSKRYDYTGKFVDELAAVYLNNKWGFIDKTGKEIVPVKYDGVSKLGFIDGVAYVKLQSKWGYVDRDGNEIVPPKYDGLDDKGFVDGLVKVILNKKLGFVDKTGKEIVPVKYDGIGRGDFVDGVAYVILNKKWGVVDRTGKEIVPVEYDEIGECGFTEGLLPVMLYEQKITEERRERVYSHGRDFSHGPMREERVKTIISTTVLKNKWGFVDKTGKVVIPIIYDGIGASGFVDGLVAVELNDKWIFVDKTGKAIIPPKYDGQDNKDFVDGMAPVRLKNKIYDRNLNTNLYLEQLKSDLNWLDKERLEALTKEDARFENSNLNSSQIKEAYKSMLDEKGLSIDKQQDQYESTAMPGVRRFFENSNSSREGGERSLQVKGTQLMADNKNLSEDREKAQYESTDMSGVKKFRDNPNNAIESGKKRKNK
jgi:hypothetical protein